jgi:hypothetical protein
LTQTGQIQPLIRIAARDSVPVHQVFPASAMLFNLTHQERKMLSWVAVLLALGILGIWIL